MIHGQLILSSLLILSQEIAEELNLNVNDLKNLNYYIRENDYLQNLIVKSGAANKYWQTISPFCDRAHDSIKNIFNYPMRIALYPGVSCMYYCGFCKNRNSF